MFKFGHDIASSFLADLVTESEAFATSGDPATSAFARKIGGLAHILSVVVSAIPAETYNAKVSN